MDCPNCENVEMIENISQSPLHRGVSHTCSECGYSEVRALSPLAA